jgi:hypothetical protein
MPIYEFGRNDIIPVQETTFSQGGLQERRDLQRLLREHVEVIAPETLVIAEEFGDWEDSRRRIDLLGIDKAANLVVIELKRTEDGGHMELQAIRYASMVSTTTFDQAADIFGQYLTKLGKEDDDPRKIILDWLGWDLPDDTFAPDVRIVLASAEFSKELTSSVLWLNDHGIDIRCVRLKPYNFESRVLVDIQQIIPLPEAADYQIRVREKVQRERQARTSSADFTRFAIQIDDERHSSMSKRSAILFICKYVCEKGINPDEIAALFDWRSDRIWYAVEGCVEASEFEKLACEKAASTASRFSRRRWFCDDGELVRANGKTYAFSNQWGGENWHRAMNLLKEKYPQFKIDFAANTFTEDMKITLLKNPEERAAKGTAKYQQFLLYEDGMTVGAFLERGGKRSWLDRDVKYGHIFVK